ncbi:nuclear transport factor 2 family protein [Streptomyces sp. NPDC047973]|uniref:nuclear transport factor 2 family protein n=1 Tax=Streptomyces sp. NPDC047973 TaxID=3155383 RepID=UPI003416D30A
MTTGIEAIADRFFDAVSRGDVATLADLYSAEVAVWHNYDDAEQTREESLRLLGRLHRKVGPMRYEQVRRTVLDDGFVQQHVVELAGMAAGLRMPAMLRVHCDGRHIHRIEEYVDPGPLNARLAGSSAP